MLDGTRYADHIRLPVAGAVLHFALYVWKAWGLTPNQQYDIRVLPALAHFVLRERTDDAPDNPHSRRRASCRVHWSPAQCMSSFLRASKL